MKSQQVHSKTPLSQKLKIQTRSSLRLVLAFGWFSLELFRSVPVGTFAFRAYSWSLGGTPIDPLVTTPTAVALDPHFAQRLFVNHLLHQRLP
jgi:hypothetical protein